MKAKLYLGACTKALMKKLYSNVDNAGLILERAIKKEISVPGPPRSLPGEAPHIDTSDLINSGFHDTGQDANTITTRVGFTSEHAAYLEAGTANMAARPYIRSTLIVESDNLAREIAKP